MQRPRYQILELIASDSNLELALAELQTTACLGSEMIAGKLIAYFSSEQNLQVVTDQLAVAVPGLRFGPTSTLEDRDWHESWKASLSGFALGERFWVTPSWITPPATKRTVLRIDPERAFGTGTHETTRMCIEALERLAGELSPTSLLDVGTGTGLLAMASAHLGFETVLAMEPDRDALECAERNLRRNALSEAVTLIEGGWEDIEAHAQVVIANIHLAVLEQAVDRLQQSCLPGGRLILSGLIDDQLDEFEPRLRTFPRLGNLRTRLAGEWATLMLDVS